MARETLSLRYDGSDATVRTLRDVVDAMVNATDKTYIDGIKPLRDAVVVAAKARHKANTALPRDQILDEDLHRETDPYEWPDASAEEPAAATSGSVTTVENVIDGLEAPAPDKVASGIGEIAATVALDAPRVPQLVAGS